MKYAEPGTVSHGTMRSEDLISSFEPLLRELCEVNEITAHNELLQEANGWLVRNTDRGGCDPEPLNDDDNLASELVDGLFDALDEFAPPGHIFGAHEGDGSDYGFWPVDPEDGGPEGNPYTVVLYGGNTGTAIAQVYSSTPTIAGRVNRRDVSRELGHDEDDFFIVMVLEGHIELNNVFEPSLDTPEYEAQIAREDEGNPDGQPAEIDRQLSEPDAEV